MVIFDIAGFTKPMVIIDVAELAKPIVIIDMTTKDESLTSDFLGGTSPQVEYVLVSALFPRRFSTILG